MKNRFTAQAAGRRKFITDAAASAVGSALFACGGEQGTVQRLGADGSTPGYNGSAMPTPGSSNGGDGNMQNPGTTSSPGPTDGGSSGTANGTPDSAADAGGGSSPGPSPDAGAGTNPGASGDAGRLPPTCGEITSSNIEGPFFEVSSPQRNNFRSLQPWSGQNSLLLAGRVLDRSCRPILGALVDFWQANEDGAYQPIASAGLRGHQFTDRAGAYSLQTYVPGRYLNGAQYRPAHLHVKVTTPGGMVLTTQLYFPDDPFNDVDPFIVESLIVPVQPGDFGVLRAEFDFVLG